MKRVLTLLIALGLIFGGMKSAEAGNTANQTVNFEVLQISAVGVSGDPQPLVLSSLSGPDDPENLTPAEDSSTYYNITFNEPAYIFAQLLGPDWMPPTAQLFVKLDAPSGGTSLGWKALNEYYGSLKSLQKLVYINGYTVDTNKTIYYRLEAAVWAGIRPGGVTRTVVFTIGGW